MDFLKDLMKAHQKTDPLDLLKNESLTPPDMQGMDNDQLKQLVSDFFDIWLIAHKAGADMTPYKNSCKACQAFVKAMP